MTTQTRDIYRSANGDYWPVLWDSEMKQGTVRHEPALAFGGGQPTETPVVEFLERNGTNPENQSLWALLEQMSKG